MRQAKEARSYFGKRDKQSGQKICLCKWDKKLLRQKEEIAWANAVSKVSGIWLVQTAQDC
jgi:hypothetical protein